MTSSELLSYDMTPMNWFSKGMVCSAVLTCMCAVPYTTGIPPDPPKPQSHLMKVFSDAVPVLRQKTSVPLRFPTELPGLNSENDLSVIITSADKSGYSVVLGATPDCEGQHVCSFGTLIGTARPLNMVHDYELADRRPRRVRLANGITGYLYPFVCGAYCSDSVVVWRESNYRYIIGLKAETQSNVIKVANSAIRAGNRWK